MNHKIEKLMIEGIVFDVDKNDEILIMACGKTVVVYDINTFKKLYTFKKHFSCTSVLIYKDWIIYTSYSIIYFHNRFNFELLKTENFHHLSKASCIWSIKMINEKIYFPSILGDVFIYDAKNDSFTNIKLPNPEFTSIDVYRDLLFIACHKKLYIRDVNNPLKKKKEVQLIGKAQSISVNEGNIFIGDDQSTIHVYTHEFKKLKSIDFSEGKNCVWMNVINNYLICGSTWGNSNAVLIYDLLKNEKQIIPNPKGIKFWSVKPFELDNQIFLGYKSGVMVYNFYLNILKPSFTGRVVILMDLVFKFQ